MNYRFSVIIPIYNSERTLHRCIRSLLCQNYPGIQIILVNDGSQDTSGSICEKYAAEYDFIKYICQENQGVSAARNRGISEAEGEWILFVDSDDYVTKHYFAVIDESLNRYPCDFLVFSNYFQKNNKLVRKQQRFFYSTDSSRTRKKIVEMICKKTINSPCLKAYRIKIINDYNTDFTEGVSVAEDRAFNIKYALYISRICIISDRLYCASLENSDSLSRNQNLKRDSGFDKASMDIDQEIKQSGLSESDRCLFYSALRFCDYRSIYRVAKELNRDMITRSDRITKLRQECRRWKARGLNYPNLLYCHLLMLPIRLEMVSLLDFLGWLLTR